MAYHLFLFIYTIFCFLQFVRNIWNENPLWFLPFSLSCALPVKIIRGPSIQSFKLLKIKWSCTKLRREVSGALINTSNLLFLTTDIYQVTGFAAHVGSTWHLHVGLLAHLWKSIWSNDRELFKLKFKTTNISSLFIIE